MALSPQLSAAMAAELPAELSPRFRSAFERLLDPVHWNTLAPALHIGNGDAASNVDHVIAFDETTLRSVADALKFDGYFQLPPVPWQLPFSAVADAIRAVSAVGHLPVFAYMYDETWLLFMRLRDLLGAILGATYKVQPAFWAWYIDGVRESTGWQPHRDLDHTALRPDRSPKALSVWIPLTDATPLNGCMYILPAAQDKIYAAPLEKDFSINLQDVRALPAAAGSVLGWTHAALHWGGRASPRATTPRISVSLEFQRGDEAPSKTPLYDPSYLPSPVLRLKLILRQIIQYQHLYQLDPDMKALAEAISIRQQR